MPNVTINLRVAPVAGSRTPAKVKAYPRSDFLINDASKTAVRESSPHNGGAHFKEANLVANGDGYVGSITLPATTDSPDNPNGARWGLFVFDTNDRVMYGVGGIHQALESFALGYSPPTQNAEDVVAFNLGGLPIVANNDRTINGNLLVTGGAQINGSITSNDTLDVNDDVNVQGNVTAQAFIGNGAGLTGIGTGTGGVLNTGSTTIGADTDEDGVGIVDLQTCNQTRVRIANDGEAEFTVGLITKRVGNVRHAARIGSGDFGERVAAASDDLPPEGGIIDATGFSDSETMSADLVLDKPNVRLYLGPTVIESSHRIIVPVGVKGVEIVGSSPWGGQNVGDAPVGSTFRYTGTGAAVLVGDNSNQTLFFSLQDLSIIITNNDPAAKAVHLNSTLLSTLRRVRAVNSAAVPSFPTNTGLGILLTAGAGDNNYSAFNLIEQPFISNFRFGIHFNTLAAENINNNNNQILGGLITGAGNHMENWGLHLTGFTHFLAGIDIEQHNVGLLVAGNGIKGHALAFEGVGTSLTALPGNAVEFDAASKGNHIDFTIVNPGEGAAFYSDAGQLNTVDWTSYGPLARSGIVPPRVTNALRDTMDGLGQAPAIIFNPDAGKFQGRIPGGGWVDLH